MSLRSSAPLIASLLLGISAVPSPAQQTRDSELIERERRRLIQLEFNLEPKNKRSGDPADARLLPSDVELLVEGKRVEIVGLDGVCVGDSTAIIGESLDGAGSGETARPTIPSSPAGPVRSRPGATYLFYVEHKLLTIAGQENALGMIEQLVPRLVVGGAQGMVVSSGRDLLSTDLTADSDVLLEFVRRVRATAPQWTEATYAESESARYMDILGMNRAAGDGIKPDEFQLQRMAKRVLQYQREEAFITERRLRRLSMSLGRLADLPPPKAALYFSDKTRRRPGEHYTQMVPMPVRRRGQESPGGQTPNAIIQAAELGASMAQGAFDRVTEQAGAHGIRIYTVKAQGLVAGGLGAEFGGLSASRREGETNDLPTRGLVDAENTMAEFAAETGGETFFGGTDERTLQRVAARLTADLSCFHLISFEPGGLRQDKPLPVRIRFTPGSNRYEELDTSFTISHRGQLVVQSDTRRRESVLLAAHSTVGGGSNDLGRTALIPLGYEEPEGFHALVQFAVTQADLPDPLLQESVVWDLGINQVFRDRVVSSISRRVELERAGLPIALEAEWVFRPGPHQLVSVGFENRFGQLASNDVDWEWPDPDGRRATVTPIAVVQPGHGLFLRDDRDGGERRGGSGALAMGDHPIRVDQPTYLIGLVCRGKKIRSDLWIERTLEGGVRVDFDRQQWSPQKGDRCIQIRDLIRENQLGWGDFEYRIRVFDDPELGGEPLAQGERRFTAFEAGGPPDS